jgi:hypothetical protein
MLGTSSRIDIYWALLIVCNAIRVVLGSMLKGPNYAG